MRLAGGCHCGAVRFAVEVPQAVRIDDCNCSICAKAGFLHLIVGRDAFTLLQGADALTDYRFGTGTARHLFCKHCGIKSFYVPRSHPDGFSVNWRALNDTRGVSATVVPFDGRDWEAAREALG